jgi:hypothetical protein
MSNLSGAFLDQSRHKLVVDHSRRCRVHAVYSLYVEADPVDHCAILLFSPAFWNISSVSTSRSLKGLLVCSCSALACNRCRTSIAVVRLIFNSRASFAEDLPCSTSLTNRTVCSGVKYLSSNTVLLYRLYMPRHTLHRYTSTSLFFVLTMRTFQPVWMKIFFQPLETSFAIH